MEKHQSEESKSLTQLKDEFRRQLTDKDIEKITLNINPMADTLTVDLYFDKEIRERRCEEKLNSIIIDNVILSSNQELSVNEFRYFFDFLLNEEDDQFATIKKMYVEIDDNFYYAKCYVDRGKGVLEDGYYLISLVIEEEVDDSIKLDYIKAIIFRWYTYRLKSIASETPGWFKHDLGVERHLELVKDGINDGYLVEANLSISLQQSLTTKELNEILLNEGMIKKCKAKAKPDLVKFIVNNIDDEIISKYVRNKGVYLLSEKGIELCDWFYNKASERAKITYQYQTFFISIEWNKSNEIRKLTEFGKVLVL